MFTPPSTSQLSATQIGVIGENLLANAVMKASRGRLSPFHPLADDDGLDVLFFDKKTGNSVAIQLKCRTATDGKGNTAQFDVRKATFKEVTDFICTWFIPIKEITQVGNEKSDKYVITPSKHDDSGDKYRGFRCANADELTQHILKVCEVKREGKKG
jgi:hypothetical protein